MRNPLIVALCFLTINSTAQPKTHGSFTIAAICIDGILIESDTRSECSVGRDTVGYYDTVQKVFVVNNFGVANSGLASVGSDFFYHYLKEFMETNPTCKAVDFLNNFLVFIKGRYPVYFDDFLNNPVIVAGYDKGTPYILETKHGKFNTVKGAGYKESDSLINFSNDFFSTRTCKDAAEIIETGLKDFVSKFHLEHSIGGPLMALMITKDNKPAWIKNAPINSPRETTRDFMEDYKAGKLNFHFFSRESKLEFENKVK